MKDKSTGVTPASPILGTAPPERRGARRRLFGAPVPDPSVGEYLTGWLADRQTTLRPSTRLAYDIHLR